MKTNKTSVLDVVCGWFFLLGMAITAIIKITLLLLVISLILDMFDR